MVKQIKRLEGLLKHYQKDYGYWHDQWSKLMDKKEELRDDLEIANEKNAQLQKENTDLKAENRRLQQALIAMKQETEYEL